MGYRILAFNSPLPGHVMPTVALVAELARRGHEVTYVTTDHFAPQLTAAGAQVLRYASDWPTSIEMSESAETAANGVLSLLTESAAGAAAARQRFADDRPDLILYDSSALFAGRVLSRSWQRPAVELSPTFASNEHFSLAAEVERLTAGVKTDAEQPPPEGELPPALAEFFTALVGFLVEYGLDPASGEELFQTPEALTIAFFPREFQVAGDTFDPGRYVFTGPCLGDRSAQGEWRPAGGRPVLLVSLGSMNYDQQRSLLETCVAAFAEIPWQVVLATGTELDPADLGSLPPHIEARRQVPQLAILRHAQVFVSHAGMGGTMEALSLGVPVVAIPQMTEQKIIARRLADLGLGQVAEAGIGAAELRSLTLEVAGDEKIASGVRQMRDRIRQAGGTARAADEIEACLRRHG